MVVETTSIRLVMSLEVLEHGRNGTDTKPARFANHEENDVAAKYYFLHAFDDRDRYSSDIHARTA
jgi:hypothetical protein